MTIDTSHSQQLEDPYLKWLQSQNVALYHAGNSWWRAYHKAAIPALLKPQPVELSPAQAKELLRNSHTLCARHHTTTSDTPTNFWYCACAEYDYNALSRKVRSEIRKAYAQCTIRQVRPAWLADNGYSCYRAAHSRYAGVQPDSRKTFERKCRECEGGPFEFWAAFVHGELAGYDKYVVGDDYVAGTVRKLDPQYLNCRIGYGLKDTILNLYVCEQSKLVLDGYRPVSHDTNMHEFLQKCGYHRVFCDLHIHYRDITRMCVAMAYPFRRILRHMPRSSLVHSINSLLNQEEIRRSFL